MSIAARASEFSGESGGVRRLHLAIRMPECVNPVCAATNISEQYWQYQGIGGTPAWRPPLGPGCGHRATTWYRMCASAQRHCSNVHTVQSNSYTLETLWCSSITLLILGVTCE